LELRLGSRTIALDTIMGQERPERKGEITMFPGCTELQVRARHQDVLREAGFDPTPRRNDKGLPTKRGTSPERLFSEFVRYVLMAIGL